jgi:hypothetical protein
MLKEDIFMLPVYMLMIYANKKWKDFHKQELTEEEVKMELPEEVAFNEKVAVVYLLLYKTFNDELPYTQEQINDAKLTSPDINEFIDELYKSEISENNPYKMLKNYRLPTFEELNKPIKKTNHPDWKEVPTKTSDKTIQLSKK